MLLTKHEEIQACLPTSKWDDADSLLGLMEEEEEHVVVPILGRELYDHLVDRYGELVGEYGDISATNADLARENVTDEIRLIRLCQKVQLYMALANNAGLLAVSFNSGGGLNIASAEYYDKADKESINRFERDAWKKAHRNIDSMLSLLERDAKSKHPMFAELWKKSRYFYLRGDLLFTTAVQMQDYVDIKDSREKFIELIPDIKYCQSVFIETEIGAELMDAFVRTATDSSVIPSAKPSEIEGFTEGELLAKNGEIRGIWFEAMDRLRTSLAHYVMQENEKMRKGNSLPNAELSRARALRYISENQEAFMPYIETSPLYTKPAEPAETEKRPVRGEGYKTKAIFTLTPNLYRK